MSQDTEYQNKLANILEQLSMLANESTKDGLSNSYIESEVDKNEQRIFINTEGSIHLARMILDLGLKKIEGTHHHIDQSSMLDKGNHDIVIIYKDGWRQ